MRENIFNMISSPSWIYIYIFFVRKEEEEIKTKIRKLKQRKTLWSMYSVQSLWEHEKKKFNRIISTEPHW